MSLYEAKPAIPKELQQGEGGRGERSQFERAPCTSRRKEEMERKKKKVGSGIRLDVSTHSSYCSLALSKRDRSHIIMPLTLFLCVLHSAGEKS